MTQSHDPNSEQSLDRLAATPGLARGARRTRGEPWETNLQQSLEGTNRLITSVHAKLIAAYRRRMTHMDARVTTTADDCSAKGTGWPARPESRALCAASTRRSNIRRPQAPTTGDAMASGIAPVNPHVGLTALRVQADTKVSGRREQIDALGPARAASRSTTKESP
jgi:hypothetical protein